MLLLNVMTADFLESNAAVFQFECNVWSDLQETVNSSRNLSLYSEAIYLCLLFSAVMTTILLVCEYRGYCHMNLDQIRS